MTAGRRIVAAARRRALAPGVAMRDLHDRRRIGASPLPPPGTVAVSYGVPQMPAPGAAAAGGFVKFQRLAEAFPHEPRAFSVLYLGSSSVPPGAEALARITRGRGARLAWNQNGVAYPAWHGPGIERVNAPMGRLLHAADHVFYQSAFCKLGADVYLSPPTGAWEILHNAVDTTHFTPAAGASTGAPGRPLTLLLGGNQYHAYRVETALRTLALVAREVDARLIVTGTLAWPTASGTPAAPAAALQLARKLGIVDRVTFSGPYRQDEAPALLASASLLLHTQENDACPNLVVEALACGLPVVHSASGGVPELVGDEAGIGVPSRSTWEEIVPPEPEALAAAVLAVASRLAERSAAARDRAVTRFDLAPWVERHHEVFRELVA